MNRIIRRNDIIVNSCCGCPNSEWSSLGDNWAYCKLLKEAFRCERGGNVPKEGPLEMNKNG